MSVLSDDIARIGFPSSQQYLGTAVLRLTLSGDPADVVGVWKEFSEDQFSSQRPTRELDEGEEVVRHGLLLVPAATTVASSDQWRILTEVWQVQRIGAVQSGYRELYLQRNDKERTSRPNKKMSR
jgi:hypothetical protein